MSRSRKKNPYYGNAGDRSQKFEKRLSHKSMRQAEQRAIRDESGINPDVKDVSNTWGWRKELIGSPMLALLSGKVGLKIDSSGQVRLTES